ncbi:hypothetical protein NPIL_693671, partial [Nephila pilipes]
RWTESLPQCYLALSHRSDTNHSTVLMMHGTSHQGEFFDPPTIKMDQVKPWFPAVCME